jgi:hypothetical protein
MDSIKELKKMDASITSMTVDVGGIISVAFKLNGAHLKAQADIDNRGLYAIQVSSLSDLQKLINGE